MISGCLSLPARLVGLSLVAAVGYLGWVNRVEVRRWINRMTAEPVAGPVAEAPPPGALLESAFARLDSLARGRADSVVVPGNEMTALVAAELARRVDSLADSVSVELGDGELSVRARVDATRLPPGALGPLADWIRGRQLVRVGGPLNLLRVGRGEWRIEQVTIRGLPVPRALWERLIGLVVPGARSTVIFPLDPWITGVRVTPAGTILYGRGRSR